MTLQVAIHHPAKGTTHGVCGSHCGLPGLTGGRGFCSLIVHWSPLHTGVSPHYNEPALTPSYSPSQIGVADPNSRFDEWKISALIRTCYQTYDLDLDQDHAMCGQDERGREGRGGTFVIWESFNQMCGRSTWAWSGHG